MDLAQIHYTVYILIFQTPQPNPDLYIYAEFGSATLSAILASDMTRLNAYLWLSVSYLLARMSHSKQHPYAVMPGGLHRMSLSKQHSGALMPAGLPRISQEKKTKTKKNTHTQ